MSGFFNTNNFERMKKLKTEKNANYPTRGEKVAKATELIETGLKDLFNSDNYTNYLKTLSKFHNYSFNNSFLIAMQNPDARLVKGLNSWNKDFNRRVKKGEKSIMIFAPLIASKDGEKPKYNSATNEVIKDAKGNTIMEQYKKGDVIGFKTSVVFDISQTEGDAIKAIDFLHADELTGNVESYEQIVDILEKLSPVEINFEEIESGTKGFYNFRDKRIGIQKDMSELQTLKTLIHEISHAKLHDRDFVNGKPNKDVGTRKLQETQAESIAFVVCNNLGLDTSDYSFKYLAGWSSGKEMSELKESMSIIQKTSHEIISTIDKELDREILPVKAMEEETEMEETQEYGMEQSM